ncbi:MAG: PAS-domain containing protein [Acetobacteraceae bacterium]|nr:PAS-domain containing protein [Acetobacteraceae bacterium]
MSGSSRRYSRRRTGSTARRYKASELVPVSQSQNQMGRTEVLTAVAIAVLAALLIGLIWIVTDRAVQDQTADVQDRAETALTAQAATLSEEVRHELLLIDQTLTVLQAAWKENSDNFRLTDWSKRLPALTAVADDIFIADDHQIITQDILPNAQGQGIGSAYVNFAHGSLEVFESDGRRTRNSELMISETGQLTEARQFLMYVVRPLDHPKNYIIGASYRSTALTKLYGQAVLGINGVTALMDLRRGGVQALAGPVARRPQIDVSKTPMFLAMKDRPDGGIWIGPSGMDGVVRIHAFRKVPDRDLVVVVAMVEAQAMAPASTWAEGAQSLAVLTTLLVLAIAGLMLVTLVTVRSTRRQRRTAERDRAKVEMAQAELEAGRQRVALANAQITAIERGVSDGIATFDAALRLTGWNARFAAACGLPEDMLEHGLSLQDLLRRQVAAGLFGVVADIEAEVAHRIERLRSDDPAADLTQTGPDDTTLRLQASTMPDGGLVLILGVAAHEPAVEW